MKDDKNQVAGSTVSQGSRAMASGKIRREQWPWYMSVTALRQYMQISGYTGEPEDDNPNFTAAEEELWEHCIAARLVDSGGKTTELYRTGRVAVGKSGKKTRLEFAVSQAVRSEGGKPPLINVRDKDGGHQRRGATRPGAGFARRRGLSP